MAAHPNRLRGRDTVLAYYKDPVQISSIKFYRCAEEAPLTWIVNPEAIPQGVIIRA